MLDFPLILWPLTVGSAWFLLLARLEAIKRIGALPETINYVDMGTPSISAILRQLIRFPRSVCTSSRRNTRCGRPSDLPLPFGSEPTLQPGKIDSRPLSVHAKAESAHAGNASPRVPFYLHPLLSAGTRWLLTHTAVPATDPSAKHGSPECIRPRARCRPERLWRWRWREDRGAQSHITNSPPASR